MRFQAQQINCIRSREGEVVEGSEDEVLAYYYILPSSVTTMRSRKPSAGELWTCTCSVAVGIIREQDKCKMHHQAKRRKVH